MGLDKTLFRGIACNGEVLFLRDDCVYVRRERPTALAISIAMAVTMLAVYVLTLDAMGPDVVESVSAAPRVTREIEFAEMEGYCVSLGGYAAEDQACAEAAGFAARGGAGRVWASDGRYYVLGALYDTRKQATRAAETMEGDLSAEVIALRADAVRMRITAPDRQIDLIVASDGLIRDGAWQLSTIAQQLDRGEIQPESALTLCALSVTEARGLREKLSYIPGVEDNALCSTLMDSLDRFARRLEDIRANSGGSVALSGLMRCAAIDTFIDQIEIQQSLT